MFSAEIICNGIFIKMHFSPKLTMCVAKKTKINVPNTAIFLEEKLLLAASSFF